MTTHDPTSQSEGSGAEALIAEALGSRVPFADHVGIVFTNTSTDHAEAVLRDSPETRNHVGSQHAGALFTLGEAASGAAVIGIFGTELSGLRPLTTDARINYRALARGVIRADARLAQPSGEVRDGLASEGRAAFEVSVVMTDAHGVTVAEMTVTWLVSRPRAGRA
ncbi:DUF4442 domain-containing protein [Georgenia sp. TF02-10]|uniref:DUF4442 domain-containing protein n=1 Tax=Georgenia sp. TF02-10 TaxID=2917725 RepID=UPI001FA6DD01|nr:DUF4442 domain-containing protein [Georgenia sp. TF02-10]UNX53583.1 DUF4442 domain-containing protein [Georgenia sp. TF02-10]